MGAARFCETDSNNPPRRFYRRIGGVVGVGIGRKGKEEKNTLSGGRRTDGLGRRVYLPLPLSLFPLTGNRTEEEGTSDGRSWRSGRAGNDLRLGRKCSKFKRRLPSTSAVFLELEDILSAMHLPPSSPQPPAAHRCDGLGRECIL